MTEKRVSGNTDTSKSTQHTTQRSTNMAYNNSFTAGKAKSTQSKSEKKEPVFRTGLFTPKKEGSKSIGTARLKEAITIPAGASINLYHNADKKSENSPEFSLVVMENND